MKELNEICDLIDNLYPVIKNEIKDNIFPAYSTKIIEILDSIDHKKYEPSNDETMICTICQEDILSGMLIPILKCSHMFHYHCIIKNYFSGCPTCPTCRTELYDMPDLDVSDIYNIELLRDRIRRLLGIQYSVTAQGELLRSNIPYRRSLHYDPSVMDN